MLTELNIQGAPYFMTVNKHRITLTFLNQLIWLYVSLKRQFRTILTMITPIEYPRRLKYSKKVAQMVDTEPNVWKEF